MNRRRDLWSWWLVAVLTVAATSLAVAGGLPGVVALVGLFGLVLSWMVVRSGRQPRSSVPIGITAGIALCAVVPWVFVVLTPSPLSSTWLVPLGLAIATGVRVAFLIGTGIPRLVESVVWIFAYVFFGLAPLVQLRLQTDPDTTPFIDHSLDGRALAVVMIGALALALGLETWRRLDRIPRPEKTRPRVRPSRVTVLSLVGLACAAYFTVKVSPAALISSRDQLNQTTALEWPDPATAAVVRSLAIMPLLVAFVALQREKTDKPHTGWFHRVALPVGTGFALLFVANPIGNARYTSGTVYLAVLASLGLVATRPRFRAVCAGLVATLVLLFPLADAYRYTTSASFKAASPVSALTTGDFDAYAQVVNTVQYVDVHGLTYGFQALGPLVFWVPRSVWPAKPVDTGILLANFRGYSFTNLSAPLWSEFFINGGWLALVLGMFAFGMLVRRWDDSIVATLRTSPIPGLLTCILPFYLLILLRGSLLQATAALVVLVLSAWYVRDRRPQIHPSRPTEQPLAVSR